MPGVDRITSLAGRIPSMAFWYERGYVWIGGNGAGDRVAYKFTQDGKLVGQIGQVFSANSAPPENNQDTTILGQPAQFAIDERANELYIADGYLNKRIVVYDRNTFQEKRTFSYSGEGWGLTHDTANLIMSDGTAALRFLDPATFRERRRVTVTDAAVAVTALNELEFVKGEVWANIWTTDFIARVDPATGGVTGWIDLRGLLPARERAGDAVLNGIAYDAATDRLFVTGKLWPRLFEIKLISRQ